MKRLLLSLFLLLLSSTHIHAQDSENWWNDRVFYEIFVRSFYDSDGDGIGDLRGVIEKLDYLNDGDPNTTTDLGITGIWLMPIMEAASYHGYDAIDYYTVEKDYGTNDDFKALIAAAHERGVAVIIDLVLNHTSTEHPWFIESTADPTSKYADYYIWQDDDPGYNGPSNQEVWHTSGDRFYYGLFWSGMPDLNYTNPLVSQEMYDVSRFWLEEMGVDGFRLDAAKHIIEEGERQEHTSATLAWLENFNQFVQTVKPGALVVGEVWSSSMIASDYVPDAVNLVFEFDLATTTVDGVRRRSNSAISQIQQQVLGMYPPGQYATFLTNHDQNRVNSEFDDDIGSAKVAATLLLTNPGVPFIYYGEEIGMMGEKPDERIRTPMQWSDEIDTAGFTSGQPWEALDESYAVYNVATQTDDPASLLNHYRNLIRLRGEHPALRYGDWALVESSERPVYSYLRYTDEETLLILINLNHREIDDYSLALPEGVLEDVESIELLYGEGDFAAPKIDEGGNYKPLAVLPPRSTWIVELK
jgi:alpha-amylase